MHMLRGVTRNLRNLYPAASMSRIPQPGDDMRSIRNLTKMDDLMYVTYWALWVPKWQGVMCSSEIL